MGKQSKASKKFAASGQLKKTITERRKKQQMQKQMKSRRGTRGGQNEGKGGGGGGGGGGNDDDNGTDNEEEEVKKKSGGKKGVKSVDDFLNGGFMAGSDDEDELEEGEGAGSSEDEDMDEDEDVDFDDNASFASVDELDEEGQAHLLELSKLAEKDPEFYQYLQENDKELLDFNPDAINEDGGDSDSDEEMEDSPSDTEEIPTLAKDHLRQWQKALLEHRSLKALRKLLIAFRAAAHMNEDDQVVAWTISSSSVYNKLITTTLRYTPIVLEHHIPYKTLSSGKFKPPTQTPKFQTLQKMILAYFHNVVHVLGQLTDRELLRLALIESSKIIPYVVSSRKSVKVYLKKCLELWSSDQDEIRMAAYLSIRRLGLANDNSILDTILKNMYLCLVRSSKSTSTHTLPSITLMKNSASEVFCIDHGAAYQHAFGYIRQLAIHLRNSMKIKTKESYKQVYNWQFVHSVDFWCMVLGKACSKEAEIQSGKESEMKPLIYPLVQVALGAIKLIPNSRSYPFHLQILRSLINLTKRTEIYIPLSPYLVPILTSIISPTSKPKSSSLKPLDFEVQIRVPQQYVKTRVYNEGITEETIYLLAEWLTSSSVHGSIGFPEISVPVSVMLRRSLKNAKNMKSGNGGGGGGGGSGTSKEQGLVRTFVERLEESGKWVENQRQNVTFAPGKMGLVREWEEKLKEKLVEAPLSKYMRVQIKSREKKRSLIEKARVGEGEMVGEEDLEESD